MRKNNFALLSISTAKSKVIRMLSFRMFDKCSANASTPSCMPESMQTQCNYLIQTIAAHVGITFHHSESCGETLRHHEKLKTIESVGWAAPDTS